MKDDNNRRTADRRSFLAAAGATGVAGIAGCLGEDNGNGGGNGGNGGNGGGNGAAGGEEGTIRMHTSTEGTSAYAMSQGIAAVVNEHSDDVYVEGLTSAGSEANVGLLGSQESEMGYIDDTLERAIRAEEEPFDQLDYDPVQVFFFYDISTFWVTADEAYQSVMDIDEDTSISPNVAGSTNRTTLQLALEEIGISEDDYTLDNINQADQASAFNEGRLDVGILQLVGPNLAGWGQEIVSTVDAQLLDYPDDAAQTLEESDIVVDWFDRDEDISDGLINTPEEVLGIAAPYIHITRGDMDYDTISEFLWTMYDHRDELGQYHDLLELFEDDDYWVDTAFPEMPFHPAAADFFQEIGVWNDDWEVYEQ
ncbi:TAXI family TRAP transporter solute-binding subunit [Salinadaptatus halalkaliphilus]|uniref:TAXI family TRAP transporter solute-binding subunit n=1 Tax=Salinadaptatus halalkaliphilus TaxID=2419781 RepID=A0A4V3VLL8_9EURY|nr:TAXI family TRAP transporter solute-binding subunit [Salinadaptatus halalkaliphilus]THE66117.1 TAXI family TRAP transporter solute-binding subunit [Salinadaptatus halalkaliphilus]